MKITILAVGKIKEKYLKDAVAEYSKRLSRYCRIELIEVDDEKTPDGASDAMEEQILAKEAGRLERYLGDDACVVTLEIDGKMLNSEELATHMEKWFVEGKSTVVFVIGGSLGLHDTIKKRADFALSFSRMTFPHQLMRVILLEQLYRGFRILHHEPYHK